MASASSTSARTLFADSKQRLAERVVVNVHNVGSVARQVHKNSSSASRTSQGESPAAAARSLCQAEAVMENSFNNLQKAQVLMAQLNYQHGMVAAGMDRLEGVREQIRDMQR